MEPKYSLGEKVFAKIRGYPPWPAKVYGVTHKSPNKIKYNIIFYGSKDTSVVKAEEVWPFVGNWATLGNPKKQRKSFVKAMNDVEKELTPQEREQLRIGDRPVNDQSQSDIDTAALGSIDNPSTSATPQASAITFTTKPKDQSPVLTSKVQLMEKKKYEIDSNQGPKTAPSLVGNRPPPQPAPSKSQLQSVKPVHKLTTRYNRRCIKKLPTKRSAETDDSDEGSPSTENLKRSKKSTEKSESSDSHEIDSNQDPKTAPSLVGNRPPPQPASSKSHLQSVEPVHKLTIRFNRRCIKKLPTKRSADTDDSDEDSPSTENPKRSKKSTEKSESSDSHKKSQSDGVVDGPLEADMPRLENTKGGWDELALKYAISLKTKVVRGEYKMDHGTKLKAETLKLATPELPDPKMVHFSTEIKMIELDLGIKDSLSLKKADLGHCLTLMDELYELPIKAIMLKKHPEIVATIKKVKRYVGNTEVWDMEEDEIAQFKERCNFIRTKADSVYSKFESLFTVPPGESFGDFFPKEIAKFSRKTKNMSQPAVFSLTSEDSL